MPTKKKAKPKVQAPMSLVARINGNMSKLVLGLLTVVGGGGTALSYNAGHGADERTAKVEVRLDVVERDAGVMARKVDRIDRRTVRTETMMELMLDRAGVPESKRPPRVYGPERE